MSCRAMPTGRRTANKCETAVWRWMMHVVSTNDVVYQPVGKPCLHGPESRRRKRSAGQLKATEQKGLMMLRGWLNPGVGPDWRARRGGGGRLACRYFAVCSLHLGQQPWPCSAERHGKGVIWNACMHRRLRMSLCCVAVAAWRLSSLSPQGILRCVEEASMRYMCVVISEGGDLSE